MKAVIVVPTIREESIKKFLAVWEEEFRDREHKIIVVEDNPTKTFDLKTDNLSHYSWEDIDRELGKDAWIIPRRTDCVRSFGFLKAANQDCDLIISMDDDCYILNSLFVKQHATRLAGTGSDRAWIKTANGYATRGHPYSFLERSDPVFINHGMWTNVPDYDAPTQLLSMREPRAFEPLAQTIPRGKYYPMCGMNVAFRPAMLPAMYFLLMGMDVSGRIWPYDRFGDIWCGVIAKKICDHLRLAVTSGPPLIEHQRASDVFKNLAKETNGLRINEKFWFCIDRVQLTASTVKECYIQIAEQFQSPENETIGYWGRIKEAMKIWACREEFR
jgi:hypothetical protein